MINNFAFPEHIKIEETVGNHVLSIVTGNLCGFSFKNPSNGMHFHKCYELCFVVSGKGHFLHGKDTYLIRENDLFVANPLIPHEINVHKMLNQDKNAELKLLYFTIMIKGEEKNIYSNYEEPLFYDFIQSHKILKKNVLRLRTYVEFFKSYNVSVNNSNISPIYMVKAFIFDCLLELTEYHSNHLVEISYNNTLVDEAVGYICSHFDKKILLKDIATHCNTSIRNLQYLFRKHLNKTVVEYINERKMAVAAGYLKMNFKIADICEIVGIDNPSSFCRLFKKYYVISPKKYMKLYAVDTMQHDADFKC